MLELTDAVKRSHRIEESRTSGSAAGPSGVQWGAWIDGEGANPALRSKPQDHNCLRTACCGGLSHHQHWSHCNATTRP